MNIALIANKKNNYIQSAYRTESDEKARQERASLLKARSCLKFLAILKRRIFRERFQDFVCPSGAISGLACVFHVR